MSQNNYLFVLVFQLLFFTVYAPNSNADEDLVFQHFSLEAGLSQSAVNDIIQDDVGYYWIATQDGLNRFDGYHFQVFNKITHSGLNSSFITVLKKVSSNTLLLGTHTGLHTLNVEENEITLLTSPKKKITPHVHDIYVGDNGDIVVATNKGVIKWNRDFQLVSYPSLSAKLTDGFVLKFFTFNNTQIAITRDQGLVALEKTSELPKELLPFKNKLVKTISQIGDQTWVSTSDGIYIIEEDNVYKVSDLTSISQIVQSSSNTIWLAGPAGTYVAHNANQPVANNAYKFLKVTVNANGVNTLKDSYIHKIFVDNRDIIWMGTQNSGLAMHNPQSEWLSNINSSAYPSLPSNNVVSILKSSAGNLWVGTNFGAAEIDFSTNQLIKYNVDSQAAFKDNWIATLAEAKDGTIWAGFYNGEIAYKPVGADKFMTLSLNGLFFQSTAMLVDETSLYVATRNNGYFIINTQTKTFERIHKDGKHLPGLPTNRIQNFYLDDNQDMWIATFDSGLLRVIEHGKRYEIFAHDPNDEESLSDNLVLVMSKPTKDHLWIGTKSGLNKLNLKTKKMTRFLEKDGLPNETIYSILADKNNNLWLSTNSGLVKFTPEAKTFNLFTQSDGFVNTEYNSNAYFMENDGDMYFGGGSGLSKINPLFSPQQADSLPTVIVDFNLFNRPLTKTEKHHILKNKEVSDAHYNIDYFHTMFSFKFSTLAPETINKTLYRYKLVKFDRNWITLNRNEHTATYTNIPSGTYELHTQSKLPGSEWSEATKTSIHIKEAAWLSLPAIIFYIICFSSVIFFVLKQIKDKREAEKNSFLSIQKNEQKLMIALSVSRDMLWEVDFKLKKVLFRHGLSDNSAKLVDHEFDWHGKKTLAMFVHPNDLDEVYTSLTDHLNSPSYEFDNILRSRFDQSNSYMWVHSVAKVTERDLLGAPLRLFGVTHNIDDLKNAQSNLEQLNQELEARVSERTRELNRSNLDLTHTLSDLKKAQTELVESQKMASLGAMVAGISHEVNTPLGVCVTAVSHLTSNGKKLFASFENKTLSMQEFSKFKSSFIAGVDLVEANLNRASNLVRSFKQVSVDQSSEQKREFNIEKIVNDTVFSIKPKFKQLNHQVIVECKQELILNSYPGAVSQIIINLIMNSLVHGFSDNENGSINITISQIEDKVHDEILIIYADNGVGMTAENLTKVFDPFFTTNRSGGNTGLGMHIIYNLITQKLNGAIVANSWNGQGVEFYIRLPKNIES